jgi:hypothetical protein
MSLLAFAAIVVTTGGGAPGTVLPAPDNTLPQVELSQLIIQRRTVIRISPVFTTEARPAPVVWTEHDAPKCIDMAALAGLAITRPDSIDLVLRGGQRLRAKLEKTCPSVDFYSGFYVKPNKDGRICRGRDTIHSRTGGACTIDKFKQLVAKKAKHK